MAKIGLVRIRLCTMRSRAKVLLNGKMRRGSLAIEMPAMNRESDAEKLEILVPLDKRMLDMMVAV
jgi:hypothetical protein